MGDLFNSDMHAGGGSLVPGDGSDPEMWIKVLGNIMDRRLPVDTYVPGHGPVHPGRGVKDLEEAQRYFIVDARRRRHHDEPGKEPGPDHQRVQGARRVRALRACRAFAGDPALILLGADGRREIGALRSQGSVGFTARLVYSACYLATSLEEQS